MSNAEKIIAEEYFNWANLYVSGCYIVNSTITNPKVYHTASFSLINTGKKKIGITNDHVLKKYSELHEKYDNTDFYVGSFYFDPFDLIIDRSHLLDLATFDFDNVKPFEIGNDRQYCSVKNWPPDRVVKDDKVVYSGYPAQFVWLFRSYGATHFGPYSATFHKRY